MRTIGVSLIGFGNVGKAFAQLLLDKRAEVHERYGLDFQVVAIKTSRHGSAVNPDGLDLVHALDVVRKGKSLDNLSVMDVPDDLEGFLAASGSALMAENTPVSYLDGQPALDHIRIALKRGLHVVTANKGPVVHAVGELQELAAASGCRFLFEFTVMDGAPIFSLWREALPGAALQSFRGVLNSTTNLIPHPHGGGRGFLKGRGLRPIDRDRRDRSLWRHRRLGRGDQSRGARQRVDGDQDGSPGHPAPGYRRNYNRPGSRGPQSREALEIDLRGPAGWCDGHRLYQTRNDRPLRSSIQCDGDLLRSYLLQRRARCAHDYGS